MKPTLNTYASAARSNSLRWFPQQSEWSHDVTLAHYALGAAEEAGEVAGIIKKVTAYAEGQANRRSLDELPGEIMDALIYLFALAGYLDIDLDAAWQDTVVKCEARWGPDA